MKLACLLLLAASVAADVATYTGDYYRQQWQASLAKYNKLMNDANEWAGKAVDHKNIADANKNAWDSWKLKEHHRKKYEDHVEGRDDAFSNYRDISYHAPKSAQEANRQGERLRLAARLAAEKLAHEERSLPIETNMSYYEKKRQSYLNDIDSWKRQIKTAEDLAKEMQGKYDSYAESLATENANFKRINATIHAEMDKTEQWFVDWFANHETVWPRNKTIWHDNRDAEESTLSTSHETKHDQWLAHKLEADKINKDCLVCPAVDPSCGSNCLVCATTNKKTCYECPTATCEKPCVQCPKVIPQCGSDCEICSVSEQTCGACPKATCTKKCKACPSYLPSCTNCQQCDVSKRTCTECPIATCTKPCVNCRPVPPTCGENCMDCKITSNTCTTCGSAVCKQFYPASSASWYRVVDVYGSTIRRNTGRNDFNSRFKACPVVRYSTNGVTRTVYVRKQSGLTLSDPYSVFTTTWASGNNILHRDFELYDNAVHAQKNYQRWNYCNYDDPDVGFPRDCGKSGPVAWTWFTFPGWRFNNRYSPATFDIQIPTAKVPCLSNARN